MFMPFISGYGKKWYFLTASLTLRPGHHPASFKELLKAAGGTIVGEQQACRSTPRTTGSFVLKDPLRHKPDVVLGGVPAGAICPPSSSSGTRWA